MNQIIVDLIKDKIDGVEKSVEEVKSEITLMREDVAKLLQFKWQIIGGSVVLSVLVTIAFQMAQIIFKT